jgi:asparagine synthase (glutamine-hydrolysing)
MCGIAGLFRINDSVTENEMIGMTNSIKHRGPDGYGIKLFEKGGIGHRRLSIIDLEAGKQPMCNEDETIWITFNGEIYNFLELYAQLKNAGHTFKTKSDTEVIIHGYEQWGYDIVKKLRGMFSFALVDTKNKKVFCARDNFGIKPFYYFKTDTCFSFASELQAFNEVNDFNPEIDLKAVDEYLWLQYIPAPKTVFKNTFKLKPAHYIVYNFNGKLEEPVQYWDVDFSRKKIKTEKEWIEELDAVLKKSVEAHLVSDVPFGAFLSGGIDSTLVVSYMAKILKQPVKTFSIGFDEANFNELEYSNLAAKKYNTDHYTEIVTPNALDVLPKLVQHYGEPYGDSSAIPTYYVCELARKHVTMVLSGDGGDEGFAGYGSYLAWMQNDPANYREGWKKKYYDQLHILFPSRFPKRDELNRWLGYIEYLSVDNRQGLWKNEYKENLNTELKIFNELHAHTSDYSLANKAQYMDMKTYMNYDILTKVDVASMIHSLEVRTPLIDKDVWEFAATIPEEFNINKNNSEKKWEGKILLKKLLSCDFDKDFIYRKKMGFGVPISKWFAAKGELRNVLEDYLLSSDSSILHYFEKEKINQLIGQNHTGPLWLLLFLEEWLRNFKSKRKNKLHA